MDTRSKIRTPGQGSDSATPPENLESRAQELATKEFELREIERSMREKEARLRSQEASLLQKLDEIDASKRNLEKEIENFHHKMATRELEITAREREAGKRWNDSDVTPIEAPTQITPREPIAPIYPGYAAPVNRAPNNASDESPAPRVSFREATESVPYFDGYNIPFTQFTSACRRAQEVIPSSAERNLTKLLINKLGKRAYYTVADEPCDTVTELIDLLHDVFGTRKTIDQYRGELGAIYIKPGEHMVDYIYRVKDLRTAILDAERRERGRVDPQFLAEIDGLTARSFCQGLPMEYRNLMGPETRQRFTAAFAAAKAIAKEKEIDKQRFEPKPRERDTRYAAPIGRPVAHSTPLRSDRANYRNDNPRREFPHRETTRDLRNSSNDAPRRSPDSRELRPSDKFCRYCKNRGHEIDECRKRQYNNARKNESGNDNGPSGRRDGTRTDEMSKTRPVRPINVEGEEENDSDHESQS